MSADDTSNSNPDYYLEEERLLQEMKKQFERETTLLFAQIKRRCEDDTLKENKKLSEELSVSISC